MENKNTVIEAKIGNLNELTKVLSVKEQAQEQLLVVMKALGIGKIVRNLKFEKAQGYTLASLFISLLIMRLWGFASMPFSGSIRWIPTSMTLVPSLMMQPFRKAAFESKESARCSTMSPTISFME